MILSFFRFVWLLCLVALHWGLMYAMGVMWQEPMWISWWALTLGAASAYFLWLDN